MTLENQVQLIFRCIPEAITIKSADTCKQDTEKGNKFIKSMLELKFIISDPKYKWEKNRLEQVQILQKQHEDCYERAQIGLQCVRDQMSGQYRDINTCSKLMIEKNEAMLKSKQVMMQKQLVQGNSSGISSILEFEILHADQQYCTIE